MSLLNTRLLELRVSSPDLDQWTLRASQYGAFDAFKKGNTDTNSIISQALEQQAMSAIDRVVKVPVFDSQTVSIGSARSVTIADSENDSTFYTVTFVTYSWGFTIVPVQHGNNEITMQDDFNRKFNKYLMQFAIGVDNAAIAALETAKTQVFGDTLTDFTTVSNSLTSSLANSDEFVGALPIVMGSNDFYGPYTIVGNPGFQHHCQKLQQHAVYNDVNKNIQLNNMDIRYSNRLANGVGYKATAFILNSGSVGLLFRHEAESVEGRVTADGHEWGKDVLPMLDIPVSTYFYESVGDYNAIAGAATASLTRAFKQHFGFSIDIAYVTAYNTDLSTYANPIMRAQIATS